MKQTELLWMYQQADIEADACENEMKRNPKRASLSKKIDFLHELQDAMKKMEKDIADKQDRVEMLTLAIGKMKAQIEALEAREEPKNLNSAHALRQETAQLKKALEDYASELGRIIKIAKEYDQNEHDIKVKFTRVKAEYEAEKAEYDEERKLQASILDKKRSAAVEAAKELNPELLERYTQIKKHCAQPVSKLIGGQCSGCHMNLPQATLRKFRTDAQYIECENCGRMIVQE